MKDSPRIVKHVFWLLLSFVSLACMEFYVAHNWSAGQPPHFSDLYAPWWGAHALFLEGRNPYSPAVAREIQTVIYGAPLATADRGVSSEVAGGFAYPLYAALLLWPATHMPFSSVQTLFLYLSIVATLGSLALWLRTLHFRGPPIEFFTLALFTFGSFPVLQGIRLQNLSLIAAGFLALSVVLLTSGFFSLAGVLLAISSFKPQFTIVLVPWLALWTVYDWRRRQSLAWSFLASMCLLMGISEWLSPGWMADFLRVVRLYRQYTFGRSLFDVWFTPRAGPFAASALLVTVVLLCRKVLHHAENSAGFFLVISLMLAATVAVIPTLAPHVQVLLLPGLLCCFCYRGVVSGATRFARSSLLAVWLLLAWQWVGAAALASAAITHSPRTLIAWWILPLYTSPLLPMAVVIALSCLVRSRTWTTDEALDLSPVYGKPA